jgi:hypothetical protein
MLRALAEAALTGKPVNEALRKAMAPWTASGAPFSAAALQGARRVVAEFSRDLHEFSLGNETGPLPRANPPS